MPALLHHRQPLSDPALLTSPMFDIWAEAAAEMISQLHERLFIGSLE